jgi:hypothetical protein
MLQLDQEHSFDYLWVRQAGVSFLIHSEGAPTNVFYNEKTHRLDSEQKEHEYSYVTPHSFIEKRRTTQNNDTRARDFVCQPTQKLFQRVFHIASNGQSR